MLFSVSYQSPLKEKADEIKCPVNQLGLLYNFMKDHRNKRYVVIADGNVDIDVVQEQCDIVKDTVADYAVQCSSILTMKQLIKNEYKAFLKYPIADWETLHGLLDVGVSDVYVDGSLGFSLKQVHDLCGNTKIRISPTVSPNAAITGIKPNSFFIRPEDMELYAKYIDILDFQVPSIDKEEALFNIYHRERFNYDMKDLLDNATFSVKNPFIKPEFGQARVNCGQRCLVPGRSCHLCNTQIELTNLVYEYFSKKQHDPAKGTSLQ